MEGKFIIELDGSQHVEETAKDAARTVFLESAGFVVLRFWNNQVFEQVFEEMDGVLEAIWQALIARRTPSPPNPPLEGEG